jgi:hypothetical protein
MPRRRLTDVDAELSERIRSIEIAHVQLIDVDADRKKRIDEHFRNRDPARIERLLQRILGDHAGLAAYRIRDEAVRTCLEGRAERQRVARSWQTISASRSSRTARREA